jgi:hypothetical protein
VVLEEQVAAVTAVLVHQALLMVLTGLLTLAAVVAVVVRIIAPLLVVRAAPAVQASSSSECPITFPLHSLRV